MATAPTFIANGFMTVGTVSNATGVGFVSVLTGNTNGSKVVSLMATNTDGAAKTVMVQVNKAGSNTYLFSANVAAASGFDGVTPAVNLLSSTYAPGLPVDNDGQPYLLVNVGDIIQVGVKVSVGTGNVVTVTAQGGNF